LQSCSRKASKEYVSRETTDPGMWVRFIVSRETMHFFYGQGMTWLQGAMIEQELLSAAGWAGCQIRICYDVL
jgi:hypothetical protein